MRLKAEKTDKTEKRQPDSKTQTSKNSRKNNREFTVITYAVLVLFVCMMGYFAYFQFVKSEDFINSPYNKRQDLFARKVTRGEIISADGHILAETITDTDGTETRYYPYANMFAHVVGFSTNGKSGLESIANFNLLRSHTMTLEKVVNELQGEKNIGDNVVTTLNYDLQDTAYEALGKYDGAIVVMEPSTGKILAMVSKPDYDPNNIAEDWDELTAEGSESSVLLNRATQGLYPPGSVFKIFTTLEYVHENSDYEDYSFDCNGKFTEGDSVIHCYKNKRHGQEDLIGSFADSCNSSFASLGLTLNPDSFTELCDSMLFNTSLPLRFESSKSSFSLDADADVSTVLETSIGQGKTLVTPMHMALVVSAIANDGVLMNPYLIDHTENYNGIVVDAYEPTEYGTLLSTEDASLMQTFMREVVEDGTGERLSGQSYTAAGKTGTAEFSTSSKASHAWFVGYAHREDKEDIAVAIVVEDSGSGSEYAVPIAKKIFDAYYQ